MNIKLKVLLAIRNCKTNLINRARKKGIYENFGLKEERQLWDKYGKDMYKEREAWDLINKFGAWCRNFSDKDIY